MKAAEKVFKEDSASFIASEKASLCEAPPRLEATQVVLRHILHFIPTMFENFFL